MVLIVARGWAAMAVKEEQSEGQKDVSWRFWKRGNKSKKRWTCPSLMPRLVAVMFLLAGPGVTFLFLDEVSHLAHGVRVTEPDASNMASAILHDEGSDVDSDGVPGYGADSVDLEVSFPKSL